MGHILLTSIGLSSPQVHNYINDSVRNKQNKKVAVITTAAKNKELNKYSILAHDQFKELGFKIVEFRDLEKKPNDFHLFDIIYVCGGNTFYLLNFARETNFKEIITRHLEEGKLYIGVSAGCIVLGPSIKIAEDLTGDKNTINLKDLSGLQLIKEYILPHYEKPEEETIAQYEKKHNIQVTRLDNDSFLLIEFPLSKK